MATDTSNAAFNAGRKAFANGRGPLDNPYFADGDRRELFDAWSDGLMFDDPVSRAKYLPKNKRTATTRGLTAKWGADA